MRRSTAEGMSLGKLQTVQRHGTKGADRGILLVLGNGYVDEVPLPSQ